VRGDIYTDNLSVMEGAEFSGTIQMRTDESKVLDFEPKRQELSLVGNSTASRGTQSQSPRQASPPGPLATAALLAIS